MDLSDLIRINTIYFKIKDRTSFVKIELINGKVDKVSSCLRFDINEDLINIISDGAKELRLFIF